MEYSKELKISQTSISGLVVLDQPVHGDNRGWFKENFQRAKMVELGLPDIKIVQNNISFNAERGVTRGIHAEPWDKFISVASGSVFGAWVDLRAGSSTYGEVFTTTLDPSKAIFVPRGVGNSFQALENGTAYTYLVNDHWSEAAGSEYTFVNLADPDLSISWPIPLDSKEVELSDKDKAHPILKDVKPMLPKKTLVIGANGQLGRAVQEFVMTNSFANGGKIYPETFIFTDAVISEAPSCFTMTKFDATDESGYTAFNWSQIGTIINCAAYTNVDGAETDEGRRLAWKINAGMPSKLAQIASKHSINLVHISSDYVFDGELCAHPSGVPHDNRCEYLESRDFAPLGVYGQSKAAGDISVATAPKHYILRTSWVIGDGGNFVKTMFNLAKKGVKPEVVDDQFGRLTFTDTLTKAIFHLLESGAEFGTYNVSNSGEVATWADIAAKVYELAGASSEDVSPVTTAHYLSKNAVPNKPISPRPVNSMLCLKKVESAGYKPENWEDKLVEYVRKLGS